MTIEEKPQGRMNRVIRVATAIVLQLGRDERHRSDNETV